MARSRKKRIKQIRGRQYGQALTFATNAARADTSTRVAVSSIMKNYSLKRSAANAIWKTAKETVAKEKENNEK